MKMTPRPEAEILGRAAAELRKAGAQELADAVRALLLCASFGGETVACARGALLQIITSSMVEFPTAREVRDA